MTALEQMTEDELLDRAHVALQRVMELPPGSALRAIQDAVYSTYAGELRRRALAFLAGMTS
jgi:hypothetical protein